MKRDLRTTRPAPASARLNQKPDGSIESSVRDLREMNGSTGSTSSDLT
jgi:hypothetical protein